jgi:nucleotide-binding universal stress UspA family protein
MLEHAKSAPELWEERVGAFRLTLSVFPDDVVAAIYKPSRSAMTSGKARTREWRLRFEPRSARQIEPLMGWTATEDTLSQLELSFPSAEAAVAYARRQGLHYVIHDARMFRLLRPCCNGFASPSGKSTASAERSASGGPKPSPLTDEVASVPRGMRTSYEEGHRPKILVVVDETVDCHKAVYYASRRARRTGAKVVLLRVIERSYHELGWLRIAEIMQDEAQQEAQQLLQMHKGRVESVAGIAAETVIREGDVPREILKVIEADEDIAILVLAAPSSKRTPEPLVWDLVRAAGTYPVPMVIVPGHLSEGELDTLS